MIFFLTNFMINFDFEIVNFPFLDGDVPRGYILWSLYLSTLSFC